MKNHKFEQFKKSVKGKNITVVGIGISNLPLINLLCENGANVTACDRKSEEALGDSALNLKNKGVKLSLGDEYLKNLSGDIIFKTPGMRFDAPELVRARENGSTVTSEMEVFFDVCPAKIIAVTGSDGKTTTTTLISKILTESGYKCHLGGNIGKPLLSESDNIDEKDIVVLELSSFQLHTMKKSADVSVVTNISPNHLDMHKSYEEYIDAKRNIYIHQDKDGILVVNKENEKSYECAKSAKGTVRTFGYDKNCSVYTTGGEIFAFGEKIMDTKDIKIPGEHNVQNYMAAIAATYPLAKKEACLTVAKTFGGVEHRIEFVRELDGVSYYNSSIDSSPNRTINTLKVFNQKVILIAGGKDKGISYDDLGASLIDKVKLLILVGKTADVIKKSAVKEAKKRNVSLDLPIVILDNYKNAVSFSKENAVDGDIVIMSNASTSFDMFKNFEERGNLFKKLVKEL